MNVYNNLFYWEEIFFFNNSFLIILEIYPSTNNLSLKNNNISCFIILIHDLSAWLKICWLHSLQRIKNLIPTRWAGGPGYDTKLHLMVRIPFRSSRECGVPNITITPMSTDPNLLGSLDQKDGFENYLYLIGPCASKKKLKETAI